MKNIENLINQYDKSKLNRSITYLKLFFLDIKKNIKRDNFNEISELVISHVSYPPKKLILANSLNAYKENNFKDLNTPYLTTTINELINKRKFYPQKKLASKKIKSNVNISISKISIVNSTKPIYNSPKS